MGYGMSSRAKEKPKRDSPFGREERRKAATHVTGYVIPGDLHLHLLSILAITTGGTIALLIYLHLWMPRHDPGMAAYP